MLQPSFPAESTPSLGPGPLRSEDRSDLGGGLVDRLIDDEIAEFRIVADLDRRRAKTFVDVLLRFAPAPAEPAFERRMIGRKQEDRDRLGEHRGDPPGALDIDVQ